MNVRWDAAVRRASTNLRSDSCIGPPRVTWPAASIAPVNDTPPNPVASSVRSYALDADRARRLWQRVNEW